MFSQKCIPLQHADIGVLQKISKHCMILIALYTMEGYPPSYTHPRHFTRWKVTLHTHTLDTLHDGRLPSFIHTPSTLYTMESYPSYPHPRHFTRWKVTLLHTHTLDTLHDGRLPSFIPTPSTLHTWNKGIALVSDQLHSLIPVCHKYIGNVWIIKQTLSRCKLMDYRLDYQTLPFTVTDYNRQMQHSQLR